MTRPVGRFSPQRCSCRQLRGGKNWGLSPVVNSCLIPLDVQRSPNFPPSEFTTISSNDYHLGADTVCTTIREELLEQFCGVRLVAHIIHPKYNVKSRRPLRECTVSSPERLPPWVHAKYAKPSPSVSSARVCVDCLIPLRIPFAMEHPLHSCSSPSQTFPCCSAVMRSRTS